MAIRIAVSCPSNCSRVEVSISNGESYTTSSGNYGEVCWLPNGCSFTAEAFCSSSYTFDYWKVGVGGTLSEAETNMNRVTSSSSSGTDYWAHTNNPSSVTTYNWISTTYQDKGVLIYIYIEPIVSSSGGGGGGGSGSGSDDLESVDPWDWQSRNGDTGGGYNATANQTIAAYNAVTKASGYDISDFSHHVWNDLVYKIYSARVAAGLTWRADYASYNNTLMNSSPYTLTAAKYNSAIWNVSHLYNYLRESYCYSDSDIVSSGDTVYGYYFTDLTYYLNRCIAYL